MRVPHLAHHSVVKVGQVSPTQLQAAMRSAPLHCSQSGHGQNEVKAYCETCDCLVCLDCIIEAHANHTNVKLSSITKACREKMEGYLKSSQEMLATGLPAVQGDCIRVLEELEMSKQAATLAIEEAFTQLLLTLEQRKKTLLSEVEESFLAMETAATTLQKEQVENIHRDLGRCTEMVSHVLHTHTDHEVVAVERLLSTEVQAVLNRVEGVSQSRDQHSSVTVSMETANLIAEMSQFGCIEGLQLFDDTHVASPEVTSQDPGTSSMVTSSMVTSSKVASAAAGKSKKKRYHPYCPQAATNGAHVAPPSSTLAPPIAVGVVSTVFSSRSLNYQTLNQPHLAISITSPGSVAIHESGDVYIIPRSENYVCVFDPAGRQKDVIQRTSCYPNSIAIRGNTLYMADDTKDCVWVQLANDGGKVPRHLGDGQLNGPTAVAVDDRNRVIVSDKGNRVLMFSRKGGLLLTIYGNGSGDHTFGEPQGLAFDPQGNIHVAASHTRAIKVFTPTGAFVRMYGDLCDPKGITVDDKGYSFVTDGFSFSDGRLLIYDPQGSLVHQVQVHSPSGVALGPGGGVFIASENEVLKYSI